MTAALRAAPAAVMVTLTHAHGSAPLVDDWNTLDAILSRFTKRGDWSTFQKRHSIDGYAIAQEVTRTHNGWNVHLHVAFHLTAEPGLAGRVRLQDAITHRWCAAAAHVGQYASERRQSFSWINDVFDGSELARYITKQNLLHGADDHARGRYPADLLVGAHSGDAGDLAAYREYLDAARGRGLLRQYGALSRNVDVAALEQARALSDDDFDFDDYVRLGVI